MMVLQKWRAVKRVYLSRRPSICACGHRGRWGRRLDSHEQTRTNREHASSDPRGQLYTMWPPSALESLRAQVRQIEGQHRRATPSLPFGVAAVDARLPGGAL